MLYPRVGSIPVTLLLSRARKAREQFDLDQDETLLI